MLPESKNDFMTQDRPHCQKITLRFYEKSNCIRTKTFCNGVVLLQYHSDTKEVIKV